jgi:DNA-nicking Smr family endonuclease
MIELSLNASAAHDPFATMGKKAKSKPARAERRPEPAKPVFVSPFKDLGKLIASRAAARTEPAPPKPVMTNPAAHPASAPSTPIAEPPEDDERLLREALADVKPLGSGRAARMTPTPAFKREIVSEDAEVLAELSDLVSGQGAFSLTETDEYVEGARVGLDPRLVSQLRRGEFSIQAHLDLHGMTQPDAREALTAFIVESVRKGRRAVLVVHGRGLRSPGGQAVLKHAAAQWLSHGVAGGYVLAFATARPSDGGAGAVYVLLRRERRRAPFDVLEGARRRS